MNEDRPDSLYALPPLIVTSYICISRNNNINPNSKTAFSFTKRGKLYITKVRWHVWLLILNYYGNNIHHINACYALIGKVRVHQTAFYCFISEKTVA